MNTITINISCERVNSVQKIGERLIPSGNGTAVQPSVKLLLLLNVDSNEAEFLFGSGLENMIFKYPSGANLYEWVEKVLSAHFQGFGGLIRIDSLNEKDRQQGYRIVVSKK